MERRKRYQYPPFTKLGLLRFSIPQNDNEGRDEIFDTAKKLLPFARERKLKILGPSAAPLAVLRNRRRFQYLLKGESWQPMRDAFFYARSLLQNADVRISLDLDPVNML